MAQARCAWRRHHDRTRPKVVVGLVTARRATRASGRRRRRRRGRVRRRKEQHLALDRRHTAHRAVSDETASNRRAKHVPLADWYASAPLPVRLCKEQFVTEVPVAVPPGGADHTALWAGEFQPRLCSGEQLAHPLNSHATKYDRRCPGLVNEHASAATHHTTPLPGHCGGDEGGDVRRTVAAPPQTTSACLRENGRQRRRRSFLQVRAATCMEVHA